MLKSLENLQTCWAWYAEKAEATGIMARLFGGNKEEYRQKAEKLKIVIDTIEQLHPKKQQVILDGIVLTTGLIRAEIAGNETMPVKDFDELIDSVVRMIARLDETGRPKK